LSPTPEDHRARFYAEYHKEAEEYDKEFMKQYDEDLNTTLIFVGFVRCSVMHMLTCVQAGLFSAVASAFIIEINSELKPDPNDKTAALLRVLIYKIDNTTFGANAPTLPQWTGPPRTIVHVQAILFASLAASLFSAFLAMLGKQWLNRYALVDMRGTTIERSQNRQRKLDGIVTWYFDYVMESLPLMLQVALLLLGCALSRYFWKINFTIASVVLCVTSFGVILYIFAVVAGAAFKNCPYQTPGARIFRYIFFQTPGARNFRYIFFHILPSTLRSVVSKFPTLVSIAKKSGCYASAAMWWGSMRRPWYSAANITNSLSHILSIPMVLALDARLLGQAIARLLVTFGKTLYGRFTDTPIPRTYGLDQQTITLDLRCISWMVQTSLDKAVQLSTLKCLATMTAFAHFDSTLIADCLNVFIGCIKVDVDNRTVAIVQGSEELAITSAMCYLRTISHHLVTGSASSVLQDVRQRHTRVFPAQVDFHGHHFSHILSAVHCLLIRSGERLRFEWSDYKPSAHEYVMVAHSLTELAQFGYRRTRLEKVKVPRWILRFALHSLSLDPLPPTSVVADCLTIIAIDLGSDVSKAGVMAADERHVRISQMNITLTLNQYTRGECCEPDNSGPQGNG
jgi:hypothetical protein